MKEEGYIRNFRLVRDEDGHPSIRIFLKYQNDGASVIRGLRRVSRPGLRQYSSFQKIPRPLGGAGTTIVSTSRGILAGRQARVEKVGGEVLCEVW
jgi:small subunit ribosomal protein S8